MAPLYPTGLSYPSPMDPYTAANLQPNLAPTVSPGVYINITNPTGSGPGVTATPAMAGLSNNGNNPALASLASLPNFMSSPPMPLVNGVQDALVRLWQNATNSNKEAQAANIRANNDTASYMNAIRQVQSQGPAQPPQPFAPQPGPFAMGPGQPFAPPPPPMMPPQPGPFAMGPSQPFAPPAPPMMPPQPGPFVMGPPSFQPMPGMVPGRLPGPQMMAPPAMFPPPLGYPPPRSFNPGPAPFGPSVGPTPTQGQPATSPLAEANTQGFQSMSVADLNRLVAHPPSSDAKINAMEELSMRDNVTPETFALLKQNLTPPTDFSHLSDAERMQAVDAQRGAALALALLDGRTQVNLPTKDLPGFPEMKQVFENKSSDPQAKAAIVQGLRLLHRPQDTDIKTIFETATRSEDPILKQLGQAGLEDKPFDSATA